ncbi:hypothetical protein BRADI_1g14483v3 [Brachypodium distachyon]|uniref:Secreted protein n=1 Tax=Brachypodium distachyon TaxID=15368 RepID=A0A0Q3GUV9_BRADI|nr:hypothetical protein BRADI_1g14483v3 [Brachypodium distachyon]
MDGWMDGGKLLLLPLPCLLLIVLRQDARSGQQSSTRRKMTSPEITKLTPLSHHLRLFCEVGGGGEVLPSIMIDLPQPAAVRTLIGVQSEHIQMEAADSFGDDTRRQRHNTKHIIRHLSFQHY